MIAVCEHAPFTPRYYFVAQPLRRHLSHDRLRVRKNAEPALHQHRRRQRDVMCGCHANEIGDLIDALRMHELAATREHWYRAYAQREEPRPARLIGRDVGDHMVDVVPRKKLFRPKTTTSARLYEQLVTCGCVHMALLVAGTR